MQACVNIPGFPLQILARRENVDRDVPMAILNGDTPSARVVAVNRASLRQGIHRGMRYSQVLGMCPQVRASMVGAAEEEEAFRKILAVLTRFSPDVERAPFETTQFFVSLTGLLRLFSSARQWSEAVQTALAEEGFLSHIAFADTRRVAYVAAAAMSRDKHGGKSEPSEGSTEGWIGEQGIGLLPLPLRDFETLHLLGVTKIGVFLKIPRRQIQRRFSHRLLEVHDFFSEKTSVTASARTVVGSKGNYGKEAIRRSRNSEPPLLNHEQLNVAVGRLIDEANREARKRGVWIRGAVVCFIDENETELRERVENARPHDDTVLLKRLIALRLEGISLQPVVRCVVDLLVEAPVAGEGDLFSGMTAPADDGHRFNEGDYERLFTLLQAEFGYESVVTAEVRSAVLPEERYALSSVGAVTLSRAWRECRRKRGGNSETGPKESPAAAHNLAVRRDLTTPRVRRILREPESGGDIRRQIRRGIRTERPVLLSAGWWRGAEVIRAYYTVRLPSKRVAWVYREPHAKDTGWFVQGYLE